MKKQPTLFTLRRWLVTALATREPMALKTKLILGILIFLLAYATRSLHAVDLAPVMYTEQQPYGGLTLTYDQRAAAILRGEGVLGPYDIDPANTVSLAQAPGYSIYLSAVYGMTRRNFFGVQLVQNAVNSLTPILIFLTAGTILSWRVGLASGLLAALSHHVSHISNFILPDSLAALPLVAAMYVLALAMRRRTGSWWAWVLAGVLIGTATWLRSQIMFAGVFIPLVLMTAAVRRLALLKTAVLLPVVALMVIAPITIRNYAVYGEFVPVNIGMGIVLWEGIAEASGDRFGAVALDEDVAAQDAGVHNDPRYAASWSSPDGVMRDRYRTRRSLEIVARHPVWYAGVMLKRMGDMVKYSAHAPLVLRIGEVRSRQRTLPTMREWEKLEDNDTSLVAGKAIYWIRPLVRSLQRLIKEPLGAFILLGAVVMFVLSWRRALFVGAVPLYYFLFQSFVHTEFRYTLPMQYFLFVFAGVVWVLIITGVCAGGRKLIDRVLAPDN